MVGILEWVLILGAEGRVVCIILSVNKIKLTEDQETGKTLAMIIALFTDLIIMETKKTVNAS